MENETKEARALFTIISHSDEEYDASVHINVNSSRDLATLTTALAELVLESDTFAEIWQMASASVDRLRAEIKENDKIYN